MAARARTVWRCQSCGHSALRWVGKCPECGEFGTFVEEDAASSETGASPSPVTLLRDVSLEAGRRISTGVGEFDRVLGGGLVPGSLVLIGGEPGIGKSTLLLQCADSLEKSGLKVLYVCGEESPQQVRLRAERLEAGTSDMRLLPEVDITRVEATVEREAPDVLVLDSIQTLFDSTLDSAPGSVSQVRACTARVLRLSKGRQMTCLIVGHVTKDGAIAGPRVLEHMVDTVLYFEGDRSHSVRIVRAVKNRFGTVHEVALFEMREQGLVPADSPEELFLTGRSSPGSAVFAAMEGTRPVLVEVQALVAPCYVDMPRRYATGVDRTRLLQVLAVLERHGGLKFGDKDVYVSVVGGMRVSDPGADLPVALALASGLSGKAPAGMLTAVGELGLTGEVRPVHQLQARVAEALRRSEGIVVTPEGAGCSDPRCRPVKDIRSALEVLGTTG